MRSIRPENGSFKVTHDQCEPLKLVNRDQASITTT